MSRSRTVLLLSTTAMVLAAAQPVSLPRSAPASSTALAPMATQPALVAGRLIRVPEDVPTPREAIAAAQPGDVILLAAGSYSGGLLVPEDKPDITIRGVDRARVAFDGKGAGLNAIEIDADRVTLENLSAHDFDGNGFYWEKVAGFTGRYLTVWNVNLYGIYATESHGGRFEKSFVSGAADAAFYVGECRPCDTVVTDVEGRLSAIGYSGTNTGPGLELLASRWDRNGTGILPNSYDGQALSPPESQSHIDGNTVLGSGTVPVPAHTPLAGFIGIGIGIAGGRTNVVTGNTITGSARYGIALFPTLQQGGTVYQPADNRVTGNSVSGSGTADLAMSTGAGTGNCFRDNAASTALPDDLAIAQSCEHPLRTGGDPRVGRDLAIPVPDALARLAAAGPRPDYRSMPVPEDQPNLPDPLPAGLRPFRSEGVGWVAPAIAAAVLGAIAVLAVALRRGRARSSPPLPG